MNKKLFFIVFTTYMLSFSLSAQTKDATNDKNFKFYQIENYALFFNKISATTTFVDLKINTDYIKKPFFQKYNNISSLNDLYVDNNDGTFSYVKSSLYSENLYRGVKIDSYNPRGMSPNGTSIIFGVLDPFLDKLQQ